ncbi:hypothetical protein F4859DRAFT_521621 [Xylaria cf. heliscus]|nr:hypothetical protein F4859DRAFT_521621 [Xylaria cf. heliscus]
MASHIDISIFDRAATCGRLFVKRLSTLPEEAEESSRRIKEQYHRFDRWVDCLDVLAQPQGSLDNRLKSVPDIRDWFLDLLEILETNLQCDLNSHKESLELRAGKDQKQNLIQEAAFEGIKESIDRLHRLGNDIRKRSVGKLASRISKLSRTRGDEEEFVAKMNLVIVKGLYPNITDSLAEQLASSILFRRQRLLFEIDRHRALNTRRQQPPQEQEHYEPPEVGVFKVPPQPMLTALSRPNKFQSQLTTSIPVPGLAPSSAPSVDRPSTIDPVLLNIAEPKDIQASMGPRTATSIDHNNPYPRAPEWSDSKTHCQCNWCFKDVPFTSQKDQWQRAWRAHFREDLKPYVCISEDCAENLEYFSSLQKWREHMNNCHSPEWTQEIHKLDTWYCDSDQHEFKHFSCSLDLGKHLMEAHGDRYKPEEIQRMTTHNVLLRPRASTECPLCGENGTIGKVQRHPQLATSAAEAPPKGPDTISRPMSKQIIRLSPPKGYVDSDEEIIITSGVKKSGPTVHQDDEKIRHLELMNHIASHLVSLAFTSLRYFDDEADLNNSNQASHGAANAPLTEEEKADHYFEWDGSLDFQDPVPEALQRTRIELEGYERQLYHESKPPKPFAINFNL